MLKAKLSFIINKSPCHLRAGGHQEKVGQEILAKLPFVNMIQPVIQREWEPKLSNQLQSGLWAGLWNVFFTNDLGRKVQPTVGDANPEEVGGPGLYKNPSQRAQWLSAYSCYRAPFPEPSWWLIIVKSSSRDSDTTF